MRRARLVLAIVVTAQHFSSAEPVQSSALASVASEDAIARQRMPRGSTNVREAIHELERVFRVPISSELAHVQGGEEHPDIDGNQLQIGAADSLSAMLSKLAAASEGQYQWEYQRGVLLFRSSAGSQPNESLLDTRVSLSLAGVSTWEALRRVTEAINASAADDSSLLVMPTFARELYAPPVQFNEVRSISLELPDVTAREAICAIVGDSPLRMAFWYSNYKNTDSSGRELLTAELLLWFYDENMELDHGPKMSMEERYRWVAEGRESATRKRERLQSSGK